MKNDYEKIQPLKHKNILLCVSGSIASYKAVEILSSLKKLGANVAVVLSEEAKRFISPLSFEAISHTQVLHKDTESWVDFGKSLDIEDSHFFVKSLGSPCADFLNDSCANDSCADMLADSSTSKSSTADFTPSYPQPKSHIAYAKWAHIVLLAPATANTISKLAYGIADNLIVQTLLATKHTQILLAPAMNTQMFLSPQVQNALDRLQGYGYEIIPPKEALLACDEYGVGALAEVEEIIFRTLRASYMQDLPLRAKKSSKNHKQDEASQSDFGQGDFKQNGFWQNGFWQSDFEKCNLWQCDFWQDNFWVDREVIITGGGAISPIDTVRAISNYSSGKQALALAKAAYTLGAKVTLISSKIHSFLPSQIECIAAQSNDDYKKAIESKLRDFGDCADFYYCVKSKNLKEPKAPNKRKKPVLFMAAALCDYALQSPKTYKIKKSTSPNLTLELQSCQDVLANIDSKKIYKIGFKAESITQKNEKNTPKNTLEDALKNAKKMLHSTSEGGKDCSCVCLNAISTNSTPFGAEDNSFYLLDFRALRDEQDKITFLPPKSKLGLSYEILEFVQSSLQGLESTKSKNLSSTAKMPKSNK